MNTLPLREIWILLIFYHFRLKFISLPVLSVLYNLKVRSLESKGKFKSYIKTFPSTNQQKDYTILYSHWLHPVVLRPSTVNVIERCCLFQNLCSFSTIWPLLSNIILFNTIPHVSQNRHLLGEPINFYSSTPVTNKTDVTECSFVGEYHFSCDSEVSGSMLLHLHSKRLLCGHSNVILIIGRCRISDPADRCAFAAAMWKAVAQGAGWWLPGSHPGGLSVGACDVPCLHVHFQLLAPWFLLRWRAPCLSWQLPCTCWADR